MPYYNHWLLLLWKAVHLHVSSWHWLLETRCFCSASYWDQWSIGPRVQGSPVRCYLLGKEAHAPRAWPRGVQDQCSLWGRSAENATSAIPRAAEFCLVKDFTQTLSRINLLNMCQEIMMVLESRPLSTFHRSSWWQETILRWLWLTVNPTELGFGFQKTKMGILFMA